MDYKQVIGVLQDMVARSDGDEFIALRSAIDAVLQVRAFEEAEEAKARPTGIWTFDFDEEELPHMVCSVCGDEPIKCKNQFPNFCPNCGAEMHSEWR